MTTLERDKLKLLEEIIQPALLERVRIAEAVRDDARAASQRYLDEKRALQADLDHLRSNPRVYDPVSMPKGPDEL